MQETRSYRKRLQLRQQPGKRRQGGDSPEPLGHPPAQVSPRLSKIASATDEGTIFVPCKINDYHVKALVDTGASVTIMHSDLFARIRGKDTLFRQSSRTIVGANNAPLKIDGIAEVYISVAGISVKQEVLVCEHR